MRFVHLIIYIHSLKLNYEQEDKARQGRIAHQSDANSNSLVALPARRHPKFLVAN